MIGALNGKTGKLLWKRRRQPDELYQQSFENMTSPTVCDLDGDGRSEVLVIEPGPRKNDANGYTSQEVHVLDGRTETAPVGLPAVVVRPVPGPRRGQALLHHHRQGRDHERPSAARRAIDAVPRPPM